MRHISGLLSKELKEQRNTITGYSIIISAFVFIIIIADYIWPETHFSMTISFAFVLLPFWFIHESFDILSREWKSKNIALLSSIPVKSHAILGAKMGSLSLTYSILATLIIGAIMLTFFFNRQIAFEINPLLAFWSVIGLFLLLIPLTPAAFLIYISGTPYSRWFTPVRVITGIITVSAIVLLERAATVLINLNITLFYFPGVTSSPDRVAFELTEVILPLSVLISLYITAVISFVIAGNLLEKRSLP